MYNADPDDLFDIPQLGGRHFDRSHTAGDITSLRIAEPLVPTELLKELSAATGSLDAASEEIRKIAQAECTNRLLDCQCTRCVITRRALAKSPVPKAPVRDPPKMPAFDPIPEDAPIRNVSGVGKFGCPSIRSIPVYRSSNTALTKRPPPMRRRSVIETPPSTFLALEDGIACRFEDVTDQFTIGGSVSCVSQGQDDTDSVLVSGLRNTNINSTHIGLS